MAQDASFMTDKRLTVLQLIASHDEMSIYELNAPQHSLNGVTVLGMASWLNLPSAVEVLLRTSSGRLLVDSVDAHGATPLMYACRDNNLEVVQQLVAYGARPDARDLHSRTSVQFALAHPRVLWLCEGSLRRRRTRDAEKRKLSPSAQPRTDALLDVIVSSSSQELCMPPSTDYFSRNLLVKSTDSLITAITSADISVLHSLLFPQPPSIGPSSSTVTFTSDPLLVNLPDASGWSAIHYCVSVPKPSREALDALYRAGAEISLFTRTEQWTPLHCLARHARNWDYDYVAAGNMYRLVMHLVKDLKAPLAAKDKNEDTPIHIAAEYGENIEVLMALLDCDVEGIVRRMKNAKGQTALDVAQSRYKILLGTDTSRPASVMSARTVKAQSSFTHSHKFSNGSVLSFSRIVSPQLPEIASAHYGGEADAGLSLAQGILDNLTIVSRGAREGCTRDKVDELLLMLEETRKKSRKIFAFYTSRLEDATKEVENGRKLYGKVDRLSTSVRDSVNEKRAIQDDDDQETWKATYQRLRRQTANSAESQRTLASRLSQSSASGSTGYKSQSIETSPPLFQIADSQNTGLTRRKLVQLPAWLDAWMANSSSPPRDSRNGHARTTSSAVRGLEDASSSSTGSSLSGGRSRAGSTASRSSIFYRGEDGISGYGSARLRAWLKKKVGPERASKLNIVADLDEDECAVDHERHSRDAHRASLDSAGARHRSMPDLAEGQWYHTEGAQVHAFRECDLVLHTARTDLDAINELLKTADAFISSARMSLGQTERMAHLVIEARENALHSALRGIGSPDESVRSDCRISPADFTSSLGGNLASGRTFLRKLMIRKIEAKIDGAFDEVDRCYSWLRLVRDVLVALKRRTIS
ncbi:ankyrin [Heliocybe sulcata]|uniref:Ankyrin n=1 Tax=Heliocybe sulcata TaxID=5364 RepID=A0A5C3MQ08_9AGAM|nr:ankyrin [Heliocybe sulcata]